MSGAAELFTVCGSCGQQVSSFVTECPYCGHRLRKRAPKLDRKDGDLEALFAQLDDVTTDDADEKVVALPPAAKRSRRRGPRLRRRTAGSPSPRRSTVDRRPWATLVIVLVSLVGLPLVAAIGSGHVWLAGGLDGSAIWRPLTAAFAYDGVWHALGVLTCLGIFAWRWEERAGALGSAVVVGAFLIAGVGGLALAALVDGGVQTGAVGAAAALATAWIFAELRARRRGDAIDGDLLGAAVLLAVALLVAVVVPAGAPLAGAWGVLVGLVLGAGLSAARR